jgi:hypothetical protein
VVEEFDRGSPGRVPAEVAGGSGCSRSFMYEWDRLIFGLSGRDAAGELWDGGV